MHPGDVVFTFCLMGSLCAISACRRQDSAQQPHMAAAISTVDVPSQTLVQIRTQRSFRAEVTGVFVKESRDLRREAGFTAGDILITNLYGIDLREEGGRIRGIGGVNASDSDMKTIKQLENGKVYTFPDVFSN